eukprot:TRINITY_DN20171_c0_g1_i1.p1 TRINITY_DN20171_c0_g1~~TRINITY_DN20171_c0_g1_i1.p1  ORF type:complete len:328 (+),score=91.11 TRINITY_DN20171_c0_g1_i1:83-1066(+)
MTVEYTAEHFQHVTLVGKGRYGPVWVARLVAQPPGCADAVGTVRALKYISSECEKLQALAQLPATISHYKVGGFMACHGVFDTEDGKCFMFDFCQGGELFTHYRDASGVFPLPAAKHFTAALVAALEQLHKSRIVYRNLRPETIMLSREGRVSLTGFLNLKRIRTTTYTLCGVPEYTAPEVYHCRDDGYSFSVDWWSLGIVVYEMLCGYTPFFGETPEQVMKMAMSDQIQFPAGFDPHAEAFIRGLVTTDPHKRLGATKKGVTAVKNHPFLSNVDVDAVALGEVAPPLRPVLAHNLDMKYFDVFPENNTFESPSIAQDQEDPPLLSL